MSINRKSRTEQNWRDIFMDRQESCPSIQSYCLGAESQNEHSLVAQETIPSNSTKTKLVLNPNLCASAFALARNLDPSLTSNQSGKPLELLSSFTATCQQFGINPWIYLHDTLTKLPTTPAEQLNTLLPIKQLN